MFQKWAFIFDAVDYQGLKILWARRASCPSASVPNEREKKTPLIRYSISFVGIFTPSWSFLLSSVEKCHYPVLDGSVDYSAWEERHSVLYSGSYLILPAMLPFLPVQAESSGRRADAVIFYGLAEDFVNMPQLLAREIVDRLRPNSEGRAFWKVPVIYRSDINLECFFFFFRPITRQRRKPHFWKNILHARQSKAGYGFFAYGIIFCFVHF